MSSPKPLSYEPLKSILTHIEANKRFEIARTMHTIRKAEKLVPLKIDKLEFSILNLTVNQTVYRVKTIEKNVKIEVTPISFVSWYREYICLTRDRIITEYVEYSRVQLEHAPIYLMKLFFGGRSVPILVKHFSFATSRKLEFPQNAKFQIQQHLTIQTSIRRAMKALSSVLTECSFPLHTLTIFVNLSTVEEFQDEIVQQARKVIVHNFCSYSTIGAENWNFLPADTHFESTLWLAPDHFVDLIRHWKISGAAPGRRCSVGLRNNSKSKDSKWRDRAKRRIKRRLHGAMEKDGVITIPLNDSSEVIVYLDDYNGPQDVDDPPKWSFVMEVVARK